MSVKLLCILTRLRCLLPCTPTRSTSSCQHYGVRTRSRAPTISDNNCYCDSCTGKTATQWILDTVRSIPSAAFVSNSHEQSIGSRTDVTVLRSQHTYMPPASVTIIDAHEDLIILSNIPPADELLAVDRPMHNCGTPCIVPSGGVA